MDPKGDRRVSSNMSKSSSNVVKCFRGAHALGPLPALTSQIAADGLLSRKLAGEIQGVR
jgi:hypothetical protein